MRMLRWLGRSVAAMAAVALLAGCKKKSESATAPPASSEASASGPSRPPPVPAPSSSPTSNVVYRDGDGCRMRTAHFRGHEGPAWNTLRADCPASLAKPGEPASTATRPPGKEDWIRVQSSLSYAPYKKACSFTPEKFCSPEGTRGECTPFGRETEVACTYGGDKIAFETFEYQDGVKRCHRVPKGECKTTWEGPCDPPSGEIVPCPEK